MAHPSPESISEMMSPASVVDAPNTPFANARRQAADQSAQMAQRSAISRALAQALAISWVESKGKKARIKASEIKSDLVGALPVGVQAQLARENARARNQIIKVAGATTAFPRLANASITLSNAILPAIKLGSATPGLFAGEVLGSAAAVMWLAVEGKGLVDKFWERRSGTKATPLDPEGHSKSHAGSASILPASSTAFVSGASILGSNVMAPQPEAIAPISSVSLSGRAVLQNRLRSFRALREKEAASPSQAKTPASSGLR